MENRRKIIVFIVNPKSGTAKKSKWISVAKRLLETDFDLKFLYTTHRGHAIELAQKAVENQADIVVAVGGDGTVNEIASTLVGTDTTLAILPLGSGNGLARELGISTHSPKQAAGCIKQGKIKQIDYGTANGKPFFCTCGTGFDALVSYKILQKEKRGLLMYVLTCVQEFFRFKPLEIVLECDGKTLKREAFVVNCANIRQFGFNAYIAPKASYEDGVMNVTIVRKINVFAAIRLAMALFCKRLDKVKKYVETFDCQKLTMTIPENSAFHIDGDFVPTNNRIEIEIVQKNLNVIVAK